MLDMFKHKFEGDELLQVQYMEEEVESKSKKRKFNGDDREEDKEDSPHPLRRSETIPAWVMAMMKNNTVGSCF